MGSAEVLGRGDLGRKVHTQPANGAKAALSTAELYRSQVLNKGKLEILVSEDCPLSVRKWMFAQIASEKCALRPHQTVSGCVFKKPGVSQ